MVFVVFLAHEYGEGEVGNVALLTHVSTKWGCVLQDSLDDSAVRVPLDAGSSPVKRAVKEIMVFSIGEKPKQRIRN